ncbi:MAG: Ppx/GppA family phosphatase [Rhodospirillales bacterium]|nr:Ppx/GppA family phosphatase [Rhodospirillales bacterium]
MVQPSRHHQTRTPPPPGGAYAALDLGTNNCRLLVAVPDGAEFRVIDSFSRIVRLGEGLGASGRLADEAMDRTLEALNICAAIMARNGVERYHAVATEACRRARNGDGFIARVLAETGLKLESITTEREASLTFAGCHPLLDDHLPYGLVFDIGGGSTELMWIDQSRIGSDRLVAFHSIPEGVVTLSERFGSDALDAAAFEALLTHIDPWLDRFDSEVGASEAAGRKHLSMLGTSGTVTTLGALHLGLRRYDRSRVDGMVIDLDSIKNLNSLLASMTCESRANHPCIGPERADLVAMGCAILEAVCRRWPVDRVRVADRGIREGLLRGMMLEDGRLLPPVDKQLDKPGLNTPINPTIAETGYIPT